MATSRLAFAADTGLLSLPDDGAIGLFGATADSDLSFVPKDRAQVIQRNYPDHAGLARRGFDCTVEATGPFTATIVTLPRAKAYAQSLVAEAAALTKGGTVYVDGAKTDGVDTMLKALKKQGLDVTQVSKNHGRVIAFTADDRLSDWIDTEPKKNKDGFFTQPGVFSADGADPASVALAAALPAKLGGRVADLGAGWGYLAQAILNHEGVTGVTLVEADHAALDCAKLNVTDDRASFDWADATQWENKEYFDSAVINPPFHTGRKGDPSLGQAFIDTAARVLKPTGKLYLVANRHLPYEQTLEARFKNVAEIAGDRSFKIVEASHPTRQRR
jgi:16S rRNA (guanine1207-N2)-methyltransferase